MFRVVAPHVGDDCDRLRPEVVVASSGRANNGRVLRGEFKPKVVGEHLRRIVQVASNIN